MKTVDEFGPGWTSRCAGNAYRTDTCITLYLRDISRTKLLTAQEEIDLAGRIKQGDKQAREQMIKSNLRLVVKIARAYQGVGLPLLDLISEGNIGLMRAVDRFDPVKGAKLSSYGAFWIRQAITRALANQSKAIRLPTHVVEKLGKMRRAACLLEGELGREPTDEELAAEVGITSSRVNQMRTAAIRPASLDAQFDDEGVGSYAETIPDEKALSPYEKLDEKGRGLMLEESIQRLDEREQVVVRLRFGLEGNPPKTLDEIGRELGVSSERVRQLQNTALEKLRRRISNLENRLLLARTRAVNRCNFGL